MHQTTTANSTDENPDFDAYGLMTRNDFPKWKNLKCDACNLYLSPRLWASMKLERLPYVFGCDVCGRAILSADDDPDPQKLAKRIQYSKLFCACRCFCEEFELVPAPPWKHPESVVWGNTPIFRRFQPNCSASILPAAIEKLLQEKGFCQRDLYLEWVMREQARLRQLEAPPTAEIVEAGYIDLEPEDRYHPPGSTIASVPLAQEMWAYFPNGALISRDTMSGLPLEIEKELLKHDPNAFGAAGAVEGMAADEREFHTPAYKEWWENASRIPPPRRGSASKHGPPEYNPLPLTPEDEHTQGKILAERGMGIEYFSQDSICKGLHRRASLCSIDGDLEYRMVRLQASTAWNGLDYSIQEHFERHLYRYILRSFKEEKIKLFFPIECVAYRQGYDATSTPYDIVVSLSIARPFLLFKPKHSELRGLNSKAHP